jgi:hypothetical protein
MYRVPAQSNCPALCENWYAAGDIQSNHVVILRQPFFAIDLFFHSFHSTSDVRLNGVHLNIAILSRPDNKSPRILAASLQSQFRAAGANADVFFRTDVLVRLVDRQLRPSTRFHFWVRNQLTHFWTDRRFIKSLRRYDAIVVCECIPNGFWRNYFGIEKLRALIDLPILFYEVFYLGNAPYQIGKLRDAGDPTIERYDWHLAVAPITENLIPSLGPWTCIGLDLNTFDLKPSRKERFVALVDFAQPGYETYRDNHLRILRELGIETIELNGAYSIDAIRELYQKAAIMLVQSPESFGLAIAECLASGTRVYIPDPEWLMSWRQPKNLGTDIVNSIPDTFRTYSSWDGLKSAIRREMEEYDLGETPKRIFDEFVASYPHFFFGDHAAIKAVLARINAKDFAQGPEV